MDEKLYKFLVRVAIVLTVAWIGWTIYDSSLEESAPGAHELAAAGKYLEDEKFDEALAAFENVIDLAPDNIGAVRGKAHTLMRMGMQASHQAFTLKQGGDTSASLDKQQQARELLQQALEIYSETIRREEAAGVTDLNRTALGVSYANRGILNDYMGDYQSALQDYKKSISLEPEVKEGPGLLTRFMRNQSERPPSVADRANYLEQQLALPEAERLLRNPVIDAQQRAYKMD